VSNEQRSIAEISLEQSFRIEYCGGIYLIIHDDSRERLSPAWFVSRENDGATSERFYSWPDGAFSALFWNRVKWSK